MSQHVRIDEEEYTSESLLKTSKTLFKMSKESGGRKENQRFTEKIAAQKE